MDKALIIQEVDELISKEFLGYGFPEVFYYYINNKALEIAKRLDADMFVVELGIRFMDSKLGFAIETNKAKDHVAMSSDFAKEILKKYNLDEATLNKIINCIEAHHKQVPFTCIEAEICANADCYKFLSSNCFFRYLLYIGRDTKRFKDQSEMLQFSESKFNEKKGILSLSFCKDELVQDIIIIGQFLRLAKR